MIEWKKFESVTDAWEEANYNGVHIKISQYGQEQFSAGKWHWSAISVTTITSGIVETREEAISIAESLAIGGNVLVRKHEALRLLTEINRLTLALTQLDLDESSAATILPGYEVGLQAGYESARRDIAQAIGMKLLAE